MPRRIESSGGAGYVSPSEEPKKEKAVPKQTNPKVKSLDEHLSGKHISDYPQVDDKEKAMNWQKKTPKILLHEVDKPDSPDTAIHRTNAAKKFTFEKPKDGS